MSGGFMRSQIYSEVIPEENTISMQDTDMLKSNSDGGPAFGGSPNSTSNIERDDSDTKFIFQNMSPPGQ